MFLNQFTIIILTVFLKEFLSLFLIEFFVFFSNFLKPFFQERTFNFTTSTFKVVHCVSERNKTFLKSLLTLNPSLVLLLDRLIHRRNRGFLRFLHLGSSLRNRLHTLLGSFQLAL